MGRRGGAGSLSEVVQFLRGDIALEPMRSVNGWSDVGSAEQELDFGEVKGQQHVKRAKSLRPVGIISSPLDLLRRTRLNPLNFRCYAYWHRGTNPRNDEVLELLKPWIDKFSWRAGPAIAGPVAVAGCSAKAGDSDTLFDRPKNAERPVPPFAGRARASIVLQLNHHVGCSLGVTSDRG
jgi:hypothetical protein